MPKLLFLSESISRGVQFLGLQLGRDPTPADDLSLWGSVVRRLEKEFGIRHNDAVRRNQMNVPDETGVERLVAMDRWSPNFFVGLGVFYRDFVLHASILAHLPHNNILAYKK